LATGSPFLKDRYQCDITHEIHGLPPDRDGFTGPVRPIAACTA